MAIARVQSKNTTASATNTVGITPTSSPTAGNCQIIVVSVNNNVSNIVSSITQTNCTWQRAISQTENCPIIGLATIVDIWYSLNAGSSPGTTITVNLASSQTFSVIYAEYSGVASVSALDKTVSSQDGTNPG